MTEIASNNIKRQYICWAMIGEFYVLLFYYITYDLYNMVQLKI